MSNIFLEFKLIRGASKGLWVRYPTVCLSIFELQLEQVTGFESRERLNFVPEFKTRQRQSCFIESPSDRVLVRQWVRYPTVSINFRVAVGTSHWVRIPRETKFCSWVQNPSASILFFESPSDRVLVRALSSISDSVYQFSSCSWNKSLGSNPAQVPEFETCQCHFFLIAVRQNAGYSLSLKPVSVHLFSSCRRTECWLVPGFKPR